MQEKKNALGLLALNSLKPFRRALRSELFCLPRLGLGGRGLGVSGFVGFIGFIGFRVMS